MAQAKKTAAPKKTATPKKSATKPAAPAKKPAATAKKPAATAKAEAKALELDRPEWKPAHEKLRELIGRLPDTHESIAWGHPIWKAGTGSKARMIAAAGWAYGRWGLGVTSHPRDREELLAHPRISIAKYVGHKGGIDLTYEEPSQLDWKLIDRLLRASYEVVTGKRPV